MDGREMGGGVAHVEGSGLELVEEKKREERKKRRD